MHQTASPELLIRKALPERYGLNLPLNFPRLLSAFGLRRSYVCLAANSFVQDGQFLGRSVCRR